ncbi:MAG: DUF5684 domain-containing protein [Actinomycetota bacterium]|nr:DUF5684 domain-containing protein [Actinomycetota bacterium]
MKAVGRPGWWLILYFIPFVNIVLLIVLTVDLSKSFGKSGGLAVGLILLNPIFAPILGLGGSRQVGPVAAGGTWAQGATRHPATRPPGPPAG